MDGVLVKAEADWSYNSGSRLTELDLHLAGTADDLDLTFSYNAAGQFTRRQRSNDAYAFDLSPLSRSYAVNGRNQYPSVSGLALAWDPRDNLSSYAGITYAYDGQNRLTGVSEAKTAALAYDPRRGHRFARQARHPARPDAAANFRSLSAPGAIGVGTNASGGGPAGLTCSPYSGRWQVR